MSFVIKQEKFEGPLALLLELIEKEELPVSEISLGRVTGEYLQYVRGLEKIDPDDLAQFLVIASELLLIKSRSLLPTLELTETEEESIEELERRLEIYRRIRALAAELRSFSKRAVRVHTREGYRGFGPLFFPSPFLDAERLAGILGDFLHSVPRKEKIREERIRTIISLEERIAQVQMLLTQRVIHSFSRLTVGSQEKVEIIVSFLAILELAKQQFVDLRQEALFDDIMIHRVDVTPPSSV